MRNLAVIDVEATAATEERNPFLQHKPVLVHTRQEDLGDRVTRRVVEVVEQQLANGSMPA